jgi:hypothetical protein
VLDRVRETAMIPRPRSRCMTQPKMGVLLSTADRSLDAYATAAASPFARGNLSELVPGPCTKNEATVTEMEHGIILCTRDW